MLGTIRWNFIVGGLSSLITFLFSIANNIWLTTLLRSIYSFLILFALVFMFRWVLGTVVGLNKLASTDPHLQDSADEHKGTALDMSTPDEEAALHQMLKGSLDPDAAGVDASFAPLQPPKLSSNANLDAEEMAQALRSLTEE
jgi:hypothetical protein